MGNQFLLVAYDISDDKRRTKLHNALRDFGSPVQYSVFECLLDQKAEEKMRQKIKKLIRPRKDHVRIYTLCQTCLTKVDTTGGVDVLSALPPSLIVG